MAGWLAHSSGLMADALDMLADATGYAVGLLAIGRGARLKSWSTTLNGLLLLALGAGVVIDAVRRLFELALPLIVEIPRCNAGGRETCAGSQTQVCFRRAITSQQRGEIDTVPGGVLGKRCRRQ
ncbi:MAG: hypothetical protein KGJ94_09005, partial [Xanthomonadaceae bacterium]|nr:hypothetical protein [Xanthomonadaceae bacterium]